MLITRFMQDNNPFQFEGVKHTVANTVHIFAALQNKIFYLFSNIF